MIDRSDIGSVECVVAAQDVSDTTQIQQARVLKHFSVLITADYCHMQSTMAPKVLPALTSDWMNEVDLQRRNILVLMLEY